MSDSVRFGRGPAPGRRDYLTLKNPLLLQVILMGNSPFQLSVKIRSSLWALSFDKNTSTLLLRTDECGGSCIYVDVGFHIMRKSAASGLLATPWSLCLHFAVPVEMETRPYVGEDVSPFHSNREKRLATATMAPPQAQLIGSGPSQGLPAAAPLESSVRREQTSISGRMRGPQRRHDFVHMKHASKWNSFEKQDIVNCAAGTGPPAVTPVGEDD